MSQLIQWILLIANQHKLKWLTLALFTCLLPQITAQECECTNCPVLLPDDQSNPFIGYLNVSGASANTLGGSNCVQSVCVEISHGRIGDIDIILIAPDGTSVVLFADGNGGDGSPFGNSGANLNLCFTLPGASSNGSFAGAGGTNCSNAAYFMPCNGTTPCYTGTWEPWGQVCGAGGLNLFNNGTGTVNGLWTLVINDNASGFSGTLENFEIQFCEDDGISCVSGNCLAEAGTVTSSFTGLSITPNVICNNGSVNLISNDNYILPAAGCGTCIPELIYAIYYGGGPTGPNPETDPNFTTWYWTGEDFTTANSGGLNQNSGGVGSLLSQIAPNPSNTYCFVPVTADAGDNLNLNIDYDSDGCFDLGTPICFQFLNPIAAAPSYGCNGAVDFIITGGHPQFYGGNFSISNVGNGSLNTTSVAYGGSITISGLTNGQAYQFDITAGGCTESFMGIYTNPLQVTLNPASSTITPPTCVPLNGNVLNNPVATTFTNTNDYIIPDAGIGSTNTNPSITIGNWISSPIIVNDVCPNILSPTSQLKVCLNIAHPFDADLNIWLRAPSGTWLKLSDDNGGLNANYFNTCFSSIAVTNITAGSAPFGGYFLPESLFSNLNGEAINGTWSLWVADDDIVGVGTLLDWAITFSVTATATYVWSPTTGLSSSSLLNPNACPTSTTTYTLTGTSSCGCSLSATSEIIINSSSPVNATITDSTNVNCFGFSTGSATVTESSGLGPYTYSWNTIPEQTNATATGLSAGTYTVTVTDANMTTATATVEITQPLAPLTVFTHGINPTCSNVCDGSAIVDVVGGTTPYTYLWSNGATSHSISTLCEDTYSVVVTDANGCESSAFVPSNNCFQIQSILVNSCSTSEWNEEMVFFQVGTSPLNTSSLTVTWPTAFDTWQNLCTNSSYIAAVNTSILNGGVVLPLPGTGILPANANVVLITENLLNAPIADFSNLSGTLYMLFQCSGNTQGHFANNGASSNPLILDFGSSCSQSVTYVPNSLSNYSGSSNGGYVLYSSSGNPTYLNYGCSIPYTIQSNEVILDAPDLINPSFTALVSACQGSTPITLPTSSTNTPAIVGTFSPAVSTSTLGLQTYTFTPTSGQCANTSTLTQNIEALPTANISGSTTICSGNSTNISITGTANAEVSYTINGGATQTITLNNLGTATINTGSITSNTTYTLTLVSFSSGITCSQSLNLSATVSISTSPNASIIYPGSPFCKSISTPQLPSITGSSGGVFSSAPAGLSLNSSTGAIVPSTSTAGTYTITYSIAAAGGCAAFSTIQNVVINDIPASPTLTPNPVCDGIATTMTAGNGSWYEFFVDGVSQDAPSATNTWLYSVPVSGSSVCVRSYPPPPFVYDGSFNESAWGTPLATSVGGPTSGFGTENNLDALFLHNSGGYLSGAIAGQTENNSNNRILMFIDCAPGGFNNLGAWSNRTNAPYYSVENLSNDITFDPGFEPEYVLCMNQASGIAYFDLYNMLGNSNNYLGSDISSTLLGYQANGVSTNIFQGFEFAIPMGALGNPTGTIKFFLMLVNDPGNGPPTLLSNQFLTHANDGESNYGDGFVDFGAAAPDPIDYTLSADCYAETCRTVLQATNPTTEFTYTPKICADNADIGPTGITGFTTGGSYTSTAGLSINSSTGLIDVSASTPGTYIITYTISASGCNPMGSSTFSVTIDPLPLTNPIYHD